MFRIVCDPLSGSIKLYLTEIRSGSQMFVVCLVGVWQRNIEPVVCVYCPTGWELVPSLSDRTHTPLRIISVKYRSMYPDDGSHTIRNMLEGILILCLLNFYTT